MRMSVMYTHELTHSGPHAYVGSPEKTGVYMPTALRVSTLDYNATREEHYNTIVGFSTQVSILYECNRQHPSLCSCFTLECPKL